MKHSLTRTSPKGQPFYGFCTSCGKTNVTLAEFLREVCPNPTGRTEMGVILEALHPTIIQ